MKEELQIEIREILGDIETAINDFLPQGYDRKETTEELEFSIARLKKDLVSQEFLLKILKDNQVTEDFLESLKEKS